MTLLRPPSRRVVRLAACLSLLGAVVASAVHCGSSDSEPSNVTASNGAGGTYTGVLVGGAGVAEVKLDVPAGGGTSTQSLSPRALPGVIGITGTITSTLIGQKVTLTGEIDTNKGTITFSGQSARGDWKFQGTWANGVITGPPATTPFGQMDLVMLKDALGVKAYCGRLGAPSAGVAALITAGKQSFGGYAVSGGPQGALTNGTFDGTQVDTQGGGARLQGTVTSNTFTGNLTTQGGASAPVTAAEGACATLASELLDGGASDGGDGGSDGGGDAGAPPTPETVFTAPAPGVGYMAISGATLFYTVAYPYFQEKIEIRAVGTDGMGGRAVAEPARAELVAKCPVHGHRPYNDPDHPPPYRQLAYDEPDPLLDDE